MSVRVYQLAKDLGMESRDVIDLLRKRGFKVTSASSSIPNIYAEEVLAELQPGEKIELVTTNTDSVADIEDGRLNDDEIALDENLSSNSEKKSSAAKSKSEKSNSLKSNKETTKTSKKLEKSKDTHSQISSSENINDQHKAKKNKETLIPSNPGNEQKSSTTADNDNEKDKVSSKENHDSKNLNNSNTQQPSNATKEITKEIVAPTVNASKNQPKPAPIAPKIALPNQQNRAPAVPALNKNVPKRTMPNAPSKKNEIIQQKTDEGVQKVVASEQISERNIDSNNKILTQTETEKIKNHTENNINNTHNNTENSYNNTTNINKDIRKAAPPVPSLARPKPRQEYRPITQNSQDSSTKIPENNIASSTSTVSATTPKPAPMPGKLINLPQKKNNSQNIIAQNQNSPTSNHINNTNSTNNNDINNTQYTQSNNPSSSGNINLHSQKSQQNPNKSHGDRSNYNTQNRFEDDSESEEIVFSNERHGHNRSENDRGPRADFRRPHEKYDRSAPKAAPNAPKFQHNTKDRRAPAVNFNFSKKSFNNTVLSDEDLNGTDAKNLTPLTLRAPIIVKDFAQRIGLKPFQLISELMQLGIFASMNQQVAEDVAVKIARKHGFALEIKQKIDPKQQAQKEKPVVVKELSPRPPVVCVLGHVDHGKTTLLDTLRHANVASGEAGGITQHVGAYQVESDGKKITFLDTPGHAAFSKMRERGANVTDIAILIVAADDGFMPQTDEALKFAQNAGVPVVVAINKIDAKGANVDRVKQQMQQRGIAPEDWGGDTLCVGISALKGTNVDELLSLVLLQAEMMELKAAYKCPAKGVIVESQIDVGRGSTAVVIVQEGTLKVRDSLVCGKEYCRVKSMLNERGEQVKEATPSMAVRLIGWSGVPDTGAEFTVVENEKVAKKQAEENEIELKKAAENRPTQKITNFKNLFAAIESQKQKVLKVILKSDVHGSTEALEGCLRAIKSEKVKLEILSNEVGAISKVDVEMASSADAVIVGFNVKLDNGVAPLVKNKGVKIIQHNIIYELIDQVRDEMAELLDYEYTENHLGTAEVRKVFNLAKAVIGGSMVIDGVIIRDKQARVLRNKEVVFDGKIESLKRQKDDHSEVRSGFECGIKIPGFTEFQEGDLVECYEMISHRQTL